MHIVVVVVFVAMCVVLGQSAIVVPTKTTANAIPKPIADTLYFESHGRDDIREWRAAVMKGVQYIKIDLNFVSSEVDCRTQKQLPSSYNYSLGCLMLCHYFVSTTTDFNSTFDVQHFLLDDTNLGLLTDRPLVFQMCLKNKPVNVCDGSSQSQQWLALFDDVHSRFQPIVSDPSRINNRVQFVFDSLGPGDSCIVDRYAPWNSTWTGDHTSATTNIGIAGRMQMVNMAYSDKGAWDWLGQGGLFKFVNSSYAVVAWEPEDEDQVNQWFQLFASYGYVHAAGALVAFNGDPSLFHVFTSSSTGKYSHSDFGANNTITPSAATVMFHGEELLVTFTLILGDSTNFQLSIHTRGARGVLTLHTIALLPLFNPSQFGSRITGVYAASLEGYDIEVLLGGTTSTYLRIALQLTPTMAVGKIISSTPILLTGIVAGAQSYSFTHQHVLAVSAISSSVVATLYTNHTMPTQLWSRPVGVTNANAITGSEGLGAAWHCNLISCYGVAMWSYDRKVFVSTITASSSGDTPRVVGDKVPVLLGVGVTPKVTLLDQDTTVNSPYFKPTDRSPVLLATYGYSYCYNDILIDDDTFTMRGRKICNLQNISYVEVLPNPVQSYVFTTFDTLQQEVLPLTLGQSDQMRNGIATSCSDTIFHGTFDEGFDATPLLLPRRSDDVDIQAGGYLGLASLTSLTIPSLSICGRPNPRDGRAMLDTFPLFGFYNYP